MTKKTRYQTFLLSGLLVVLALVVFYAGRSHDDVFTGVHADDGEFEPLNVPDPSLRLDLLERIQKEEYNGQHRNIFSEEPLPPPPEVLAAQRAAQQGPVAPPPPPPVTVPATFYGIVTDPATGNRRACFSASNDNIYILAEGGTLLNQFRVVKIGNNTVEMQEISSGRSTTLTLPEGGAQPNVPPQEARQ
ncbi:MAG: hypothetical protein WBE86_10645 [Candidatus Acidiferrales bacterium]